MRQQGGVTLIETLTALLIMAILGLQVVPFAQQLLIKQRLTSQSNALLGALYRARIHGLEQGGALVCGNSACDQFNESREIVIIGGKPETGSGSGVTSGPLLERWALPAGMTISWRSFKNKPWLYYRASATSHFQNGHFLLCYQGQSRKVIVTRIGRPRVDRDKPSPANDPASPCYQA